MVTIDTFSSMTGAIALQTFLEGRQIPTLIPDACEPPLQSSWDGPSPFAVPLNSIRVQVPANYEEQAMALVKEFYKAPEPRIHARHEVE